MKKITRYPVQTGLQSGQKFCILHSGCTAKSLIYMGFGGLEKIVCILKKPMHINHLGASQHCTADPLSLIEIER